MAPKHTILKLYLSQKPKVGFKKNEKMEEQTVKHEKLGRCLFLVGVYFWQVFIFGKCLFLASVYFWHSY